VLAPNTRITTPQFSGQRLFVVRTDGSPKQIVELNPLTGATIRSFAAPNGTPFGNIGLAFDGQTLYSLSDANNTLYQLNPTTGAVLGSTVLAAGDYGSVAALGGKVYLLNWVTRVVSIFDPTSNTVTGIYD